MFKRTLILVLVLPVAGCLDAGTGGVTPVETTEPTPTPSATATPTTTEPRRTATEPIITDCPYLVSAEPVSEERAQGDRLAYENMTAARQQAFRNALNGTIEMETLPERWPTVVSYEGDQYQIRAMVC